MKTEATISICSGKQWCYCFSFADGYWRGIGAQLAEFMIQNRHLEIGLFVRKLVDSQDERWFRLSTEDYNLESEDVYHDYVLDLENDKIEARYDDYWNTTDYWRGSPEKFIVYLENEYDSDYSDSD